MQSTVSIFKYLFQHLPPLFPEEVKGKMKHALEHLEQDQTISLDQLEETMISFGYVAWPWNQAYKEFLAVAEGQVGEHFLLPKLSNGLQQKYGDFKAYGGTLRDLHSGRPAIFFTLEERNELCVALVEMQLELHGYVNREVTGMGREKYLRRVGEFKKLIASIKGELDDLREIASREEDHPSLAGEIRERVRGFEQGLCLLGPELQYEAVCQSKDFFAERKNHLNRMRGIHLPKILSF